MQKLIPVRLKKKYNHYSAGEVAGFPQEEVTALIEGGLAELYREPKSRKKLGQDKQMANNDEKSYVTK